MPWIKETGCAGCAKCISVCPENAIKMVNGIAQIDQSLCSRCGKCLNICPVDIIRPNSENPSLKGGGGGFGMGKGRGMGRGNGMGRNRKW